MLLSLCLVIGSLVLPQFLSRNRENDLSTLQSFNSDAPDYSQWLDTGSDGAPATYLKAVVFNVTNPLEASLGAVVKVQKLGPLVYRKWVQRSNVRFTDGNVSYDQTQQYQLIDAAGLTESSLVTSVDIFPHSSSSLLHNNNNSSFFTQRSLRDVIWSAEQPSLAAGTLWNTTDSSSFRFDTGAQDLEHVDEVQQWHGLSAGTCWATSAANELRGSMGRQWESKRVEDGDQLSWWNEVGQRHSSLNAVSDLVPHAPTGMSGRLYRPNVDEDAASDANAAFGIQLAGIRNVSECWGGAPVALTHANMEAVEAFWRSKVDGLSAPSIEDVPSFFIDEAAGRLLNHSHPWQLNGWIESAAGPILVPIVQFTEYSTQVSAETVSLIEDIASRRSNTDLEEHVRLIGLAGSGLLMLVGICLLLSSPWKCHTEDGPEKLVETRNYSITPLILPTRQTLADEDSLVSRMRSDSLKDVSYKVFSSFDFRHDMHDTLGGAAADQHRVIITPPPPPSGSLRHENLRDTSTTTA